MLYGMRLIRSLWLTAILGGISVGCHAQAIVGDMFASDASVHGSIRFASGGTQIQSGSSLTAGDAAAILHLRRGGDIRICPKTTVSVVASPNGHDILWGMNIGAIEADFALPASADTLITPDFRILLSGPGIFHFAISSNSEGDTCIRALPRDTASLIVSELNGDGTYQVQPNVQILFRKGKIANASSFIPPSCGCPPAVETVLQAQAQSPEPAPAAAPNAVNSSPPLLLPVPDKPSLPPRAVPSEMAHLQMDAPFVYRAGDPEQELSTVAARLRLTSGAAFPDATVLPPAPKAEPTVVAVKSGKASQKKEKRGFLGALGSFFARIFK
jgi:hypothetical protein